MFIITESATMSISSALYRYICHNIVGTEEHVKTIRMMNTIRDHLSTIRQETILTSGSFGEGLEMKGSDLDVMHVLKRFEVLEDTNVHINRSITYFMMATEDAHPGFTQLRLVHSNSRSTVQLCEEIGNENFLSGVLFKQHFMDEYFSTVHGPCISDKNKEFDLAYCLHSKSWVTPSKSWLKR
ncbi:unnamed protein product [Mytilus coruscus]|uniref:Uncharacterized protein n=1 Tax=Mytilus coruscus TaxID=42192 RepID=A0A6J8DNC8_MYTCO|nr:unnamed protein product [Mytilus coruscus]